jgi:[NiFe] hydrogenase small subunit
MKFSVGLGRENAEKRLEQRGVTRRDFMKFCASVAAAMGMGPAFAPQVAQALTAKKRPSVVWLHTRRVHGLLRGHPAHGETVYR